MPRTQGFTRTKATGGGGGENTSILTFANSTNFEGVSSVANNYCLASGYLGCLPLANENLIFQMCPKTGVFRNLYAFVATAPGAGKSWTITLRINGVNTALTCTIANGATSASDTTNTVNVTAGQRIDVEWAPTGNPAAPNTLITHSMELLIL